jgi:hypothetical protein
MNATLVSEFPVDARFFNNFGPQSAEGRWRDKHVCKCPGMRSTRDVIFRATDLEAVKNYYAAKLGLPVVMESDRIIGFDAGELTLFFECGEPNGAVFEFTVADVQKTKKDLLAAGCTLVEENPSIPRVYLRDQFGLVFNLNEG